MRRIVQSALTGSEPKGMGHQLPVAASAPALPVLSGRDQVATAMRCTRARPPKSQPHFSCYYLYHNICDFVNNCLAVTQGQSVPEGALPTESPKSMSFLAPSNSAQKSRWDRMRCWCSCPRSALAHVSDNGSDNGLPVPVAVRLWRCHDSRRVGSPSGSLDRMPCRGCNGS